VDAFFLKRDLPLNTPLSPDRYGGLDKINIIYREVCQLRHPDSRLQEYL
jgi:hypothetical protein